MRHVPAEEQRTSRSLRAAAVVAALALFLAAPLMSVASAAAQPISLGEWMSAIFATVDRKIDPSEKGIAFAPPPVPTQQVQASSEPAPARPQATPPVPRLWIRREPVRRVRRRRARQS
jgi:hypothetical protein